MTNLPGSILCILNLPNGLGKGYNTAELSCDEDAAMSTDQVLLTKRDAKAKPHLEQYAPVWLTEQKIIPEDEAVQFNVVFQHNRYGWVSRRYRYDGFNNVLYYKGQVLLSDLEALKIQEKQAYVSPLVADIPNAYGG